MHLLVSKTTAAIVALSVYVAACRGLRYLRRDRKHAQYPYKNREDFSKMTVQHAWEITDYVMNCECPFTAEKALQFALFRTYGIPSISSLLCQTRHLSDPKLAPRRYADTTILIGEFLNFSPTSDRANSAIARMNYLHGMYQKSGKISNDDLLYTLSLFVLEIVRWYRSYEWRALTEMEIAAFGTLWHSIGKAMSIDFSPLDHSPNFKDGLQFADDLKVFAEAYEKQYMVPNKWNHQLAEETTAILLCNVPQWAKPAGKQAVITMMDDRLREAMLYEKEPPIYTKTVSFILNTRKWLLTHLFLPRPYMWRFQTLSAQADPKTNRYHQLVYETEPWYVKPDFWTRNSVSSWMRWAVGRPYPDGKNYKPEGYHIFEVGPEKQEKMGRAECKETRDRLMKEGRGGCPFAFAR